MARLEATMGAGLYYQRKESVLRDIGRITNKQVLDEDDVALAAKLLLEARALHCGYDAVVRLEKLGDISRMDAGRIVSRADAVARNKVNALFGGK